MSSTLSQFGEIIRKWVAVSVDAPNRYAQSIWSATLSLAQVLAELMDSRFIPDIKRIKEANIQIVEAAAQRRQADADIRSAEAQKKLAEAVDAANRASLHKRKDALARAEIACVAAAAAKTVAESEMIRKDAETRRIAVIAEAKARFIESLSKLRQEGGELFIDRDSLDHIFKQDVLKLLGGETRD